MLIENAGFSISLTMGGYHMLGMWHEGPGFILLLWLEAGLTVTLEGSAFTLLLMESSIDNIRKHSKDTFMH